MKLAAQLPVPHILKTQQLGRMELSVLFASVRRKSLAGRHKQRGAKHDNQLQWPSIKEGVFDFIEKPFDDELLAMSIAIAIEKGQKVRIEQAERESLEARLSELSPRQREVMDLVVQRLANKEIARRLSISARAR